MNKDKIVFVLSKMIQHFVAKDPVTQANYVAYLEHVKPQLSPELLSVVDPIYELTRITDLAKIGKTGWMYRNWTIDAIGADIAKILTGMALDLSAVKDHQRVSDFAAEHGIAFNW